jgi:shikimate dehydrogenase
MISGSTRILAVFGDPIAHSLSPRMQNPALQQAGINAVYIACHVPAAKIGAAVEAVRALDFWGVNLTIPLKEVVCPHLDELDADARLIGAVNTIVNDDGRLIGYNTDVYGLLSSLATDLDFDPAGRKILLLGAGGACRAAIVALGRSGAQQVRIANRTFARAKALSDEFSAEFDETRFMAFHLERLDLARALDGVDLVVNASSVGLKGTNFSDFPWAAMPEGIPVLDIVYSTSDTPFIADAKSHGHTATTGLGMLAGQGERAFRLWTGVEPPEGLMRRCLKSS